MTAATTTTTTATGSAAGSGLGVMVRTHLATSWRVVLTWVGALAATMFVTTTSINRLYDTPAKIQSYADAVSAGDAFVVINGEVAGLDSLGGVIGNEFGFVASFAIPFMAVALVARMTRREEDQGRLELLLAGRIGRAAPLVAALVTITGALAATGLALFLALVTVGVPAADATLYTLSMAALGLVFTGFAALTAQLVAHPRGVQGLGLAAIAAAYLLRGVGDVAAGGLHRLVWLSPLGWQEETRAFGDGRWWPLLVPLVVALVLLGAAVAVSSRRDLGGALLRRGAADPHASAFLRSPLGTAVQLHRGSLVGWTVTGLIVMAVFGGLAEPLLDAIEGNPALAEAMGARSGSGVHVVIAMSGLVLALLGAGCGVQAAGVLRTEEVAGRLEPTLAGTVSRTRWFGAHALLVALGVLVVTAAGALVLAVSTTWSTGESVGGDVARTAADFLPAMMLLAGLALLLFGVAPRYQGVAWLLYAGAALVAYLGDPLGLPEWVRNLSPLHLVGRPPQEAVDPATLLWLSLGAAAALVLALLGFRRRGIPQG